MAPGDARQSPRLVPSSSKSRLLHSPGARRSGRTPRPLSLSMRLSSRDGVRRCRPALSLCGPSGSQRMALLASGGGAAGDSVCAPYSDCGKGVPLSREGNSRVGRARSGDRELWCPTVACRLARRPRANPVVRRCGGRPRWRDTRAEEHRRADPARELRPRRSRRSRTAAQRWHPAGQRRSSGGWRGTRPSDGACGV
jgi:hypothetical protein